MFNWVKTAMLMAAITALFVVIGGMIGGSKGMMLALIVALAMNFFSYWFSDKLVLKMYNAQEVDEASAPQFYRMVRELATRAQLPMPKVYLINENAPNAFATGRNPEHAAVAATTGILRVLSERELRGVMAHELAHVKHRDILISTVSATMAGAISALANFAMFFGGRDSEGRRSNPIASIAVAMLAPLAGALIQMAISRAREFEADRGGAQISGDPQALASALEKIHAYAAGVPFPAAEQHPGHCTDDDHEPACGRWNLQALFHAPGDRGARRAPDGDGANRADGVMACLSKAVVMDPSPRKRRWVFVTNTDVLPPIPSVRPASGLQSQPKPLASYNASFVRTGIGRLERLRPDMTEKPSRRRAVSSADSSRASSDARLATLHLAPDSLAFALDAAAQAVGAVRAGSALPAALQTVIEATHVAVSRGATQDIAYRTLRRLAVADALLAKLVRKAPPPHVSNVMACAFRCS